MSRTLRRMFVGAVSVAAVLLAVAAAVGIEPMPARHAPLAGIEEATDRYDALLARQVDAAGRVDYPGLLRNRDALEQVVSTFAQHGPSSRPHAFRTRASRLSYAINAYNLLVLRAVLEHWPIESVHNVRGWIEPKQGFGFFWALWQPLDGSWTNLYDLEHDRLRGGFAARGVAQDVGAAREQGYAVRHRAYDWSINAK